MSFRLCMSHALAHDIAIFVAISLTALQFSRGLWILCGNLILTCCCHEVLTKYDAFLALCAEHSPLGQSFWCHFKHRKQFELDQARWTELLAQSMNWHFGWARRLVANNDELLISWIQFCKIFLRQQSFDSLKGVHHEESQNSQIENAEFLHRAEIKRVWNPETCYWMFIRTLKGAGLQGNEPTMQFIFQEVTRS
jgi:hypothetical protein